MASTSTGAAAPLPHQTTVQLPNAAAADDLAWLNVNPASTATNMRYAANFSVLEVYTFYKELQKQMGLIPSHAINASKKQCGLCTLLVFYQCDLIC